MGKYEDEMRELVELGIEYKKQQDIDKEQREYKERERLGKQEADRASALIKLKKLEDDFGQLPFVELEGGFNYLIYGTEYQYPRVYLKLSKNNKINVVMRLADREVEHHYSSNEIEPYYLAQINGDIIYNFRRLYKKRLKSPHGKEVLQFDPNWTGTYFYGPLLLPWPLGRSYKFEAELFFEGAKFHGWIREATKNLKTCNKHQPYLCARLTGTVLGDNIEATKVYDNNSGAIRSPPIKYKGQLNIKNGEISEISGFWIIPGNPANGKFEMKRTA